MSIWKKLFGIKKPIRRAHLESMPVQPANTANSQVPLNPSTIREPSQSCFILDDKTAGVDRWIRLLSDGSRKWRRDAAAQLGIIGDSRAIDPLIKALHDDATIRPDCLDSLCCFLNDSRAVAAVVEAVKGGGGCGTRKDIPASLVNARVHNVTEILVAFALKGSPMIRKQASDSLRCMGYIPEDKAVAVVMALAQEDKTALANSNLDVLSYLCANQQELPLDRFQDVVTLRAKTGGQDSVQWLIKALEIQPWAGLAARALAKSGMSAATKPLVNVLKESAIPDNRAEAAAGLGTIGDTDAVDPLIEALADQDYRVRRAVVDALGRLGDCKAVLHLEAHLYDEELRSHVAWALGCLRDPRSVDALILFIEGDYGPVAEALSNIGDCRALDPMLTTLLAAREARSLIRPAAALLRRANLEVWHKWAAELHNGRVAEEKRIILVEVFGASRDPRAADVLFPLLSQKSEALRQSAVIELALVGDARSKQPLIDICKNDPEHSRAFYVLANAAPADSLDILVRHYVTGRNTISVTDSIKRTVKDHPGAVTELTTDALCTLAALEDFLTFGDGDADHTSYKHSFAEVRLAAQKELMRRQSALMG